MNKIDYPRLAIAGIAALAFVYGSPGFGFVITFLLILSLN